MSFIKHSIFLFVVLALNSCAEKENKKTLKLIKKVTFEIGFPTTDNTSYFSCSTDEYIAFVDFKSSKKIALHSINGKQQRFTVHLNNAMQNEQFLDFAIIDLNRFVLLSKYTNKLYVIDSLGKLIRKKDYSSYLIEGIELSPPICIKNGKFSASINFMDPAFPNNPTLDDYIKSNKKKSVFPLIFNANHFLKEDESIQLTQDSIYFRFSKENEMTVEGSHYLKLNNQTLFYSTYSDSLYIFNNKNQLDFIVPVISDFASINTRPITFQQYLKNPNSLSTNFWDYSSITNLIYDSFNGLYYCFVCDKMIDKLLPFSIIIYDLNFNKLDEVEMDYNKFLPSGFVGSKGLYLKTIDNENITKKTFTLFNYE